MTNRQTFRLRLKNPESPYTSGMFRFKGYDSYCYSPYNSSFMGGGHHDR